MTDLSLIQIPIYIAIGFGLGCAYFYLLAGVVRLLSSKASLVRLLPLQLGRMLLAGAVLWSVAQEGAAPLILALTGLTLARVGMQHWLRWG